MASKNTAGLSTPEALRTLGRMVEHAIQNPDQQGPVAKCEYTTDDGLTLCANFTEAYCDWMKGKWSAGERCPGT